MSNWRTEEAEQFASLRAISSDYRLLVLQATHLRERRDALALRLIDQGCTWREVSEAAGFENPYIAQLKRKRGSDAGGQGSDE